VLMMMMMMMMMKALPVAIRDDNRWWRHKTTHIAKIRISLTHACARASRAVTSCTYFWLLPLWKEHRYIMCVKVNYVQWRQKTLICQGDSVVMLWICTWKIPGSSPTIQLSVVLHFVSSQILHVIKLQYKMERGDA
jgi:hypothetical protein